MQILSQYDPRWGDVKIGSSELTLAAKGCTLTAFCNGLNAMLNTHLTPDMFAHDAACFTDKNYVGGAGLVLWTKLCERASMLLKVPIKFGGKQDGEHDADIVAAVKSKKEFCILAVNSGKHFVLAGNKTLFGNDFNIEDSWGGKWRKAKKDYHNIAGARYIIVN